MMLCWWADVMGLYLLPESLFLARFSRCRASLIYILSNWHTSVCFSSRFRQRRGVGAWCLSGGEGSTRYRGDIKIPVMGVLQ
jgi:hypothetical protein